MDIIIQVLREYITFIKFSCTSYFLNFFLLCEGNLLLSLDFPNLALAPPVNGLEFCLLNFGDLVLTFGLLVVLSLLPLGDLVVVLSKDLRLAAGPAPLPKDAVLFIGLRFKSENKPKFKETHKRN